MVWVLWVGNPLSLQIIYPVRVLNLRRVCHVPDLLDVVEQNKCISFWTHIAANTLTTFMGHSVTNQGTLHHHVTKIVQIWLKSVPK